MTILPFSPSLGPAADITRIKRENPFNGRLSGIKEYFT